MGTKLDRASAVQMLMNLKQSNSTQVFTVLFKYTDNAENRKKGRVGEIRSLNGAFHVKKYLAGGPPAYDPYEKGMFVVCDMQVVRMNRKTPDGQKPRPYRSFHWADMVGLKTGGEIFEIV